MVRRLLSLFKKPSLQVRELDDMASIVEDFQNHGFAIVMLRPEHTLQTDRVLEHRDPGVGSYSYQEVFGPSGYL